ncbi:hypothetical protein V1514DRAFT_334230 [Lipomyces japonicus]|uniref:mitochondrial 54S ribosomal protein bL28m n=1 Tax=Lipomyces japonicus TaxID=56871 RepID=UPI0034CE5553
MHFITTTRLTNILRNGLSFNYVRQFSSSARMNRLYNNVITRRVKRTPAASNHYWVKQHLRTGRRIKYPPYPYGDSQIFAQSNFGLYGGKVPQFGNQVSEEGNKKRRNWLPNIMQTTLYSETLKSRFRLKVVASVLRSIKNEGGLDNYLTKDKAARIKEIGPRGWRMRYAILLRKQEIDKRKLKLNIISRKRSSYVVAAQPAAKNEQTAKKLQAEKVSEENSKQKELREIKKQKAFSKFLASTN